MTIPLPTIDKLIEEALAKHEQKPDYAAFCLSEAHEQLTAFKNEMDADHERRRDDIHNRCHIANELNSRDIMPLMDKELILFWSESFDTRHPVITEWAKLGQAWHKLFHDDKRAMECSNNTFYLDDDNFSCAAIYYHLRFAVCIFWGEQDKMMHSVVNNIENILSGKPQLLADLANFVYMIGNQYLKDAIGCLQSAEKSAKDTKDWIKCALIWFNLADEKWNDNAKRCISEGEILANTHSDWFNCCCFYLDVNNCDDAERCLQILGCFERYEGLDNAYNYATKRIRNKRAKLAKADHT